MNVLVNCFHLLPSKAGAGGAGSYVRELLRELKQMADLRVLLSTQNADELPFLSDSERRIVEDNHVDIISDDVNWADIYFCPLNGVSPEFFACSAPIVTTILDIQHAVLPQFFSEDVRQLRHRIYGLSVARADRVLTISEFEKRNIQSLYGKEAVDVTYLSGYLADRWQGSAVPVLSPEVLDACPDILDRPFLLYPAIPWGHKNHFRLLQAFARLRRETRFRDHRLVLTGAEGHGLVRGGHVDLLDELGLRRHVARFGHIPDGDLFALFKAARLLAFPSLYEGFGIPVVDAMKLRVPVIASPMAAVPEVGGDTILYFRNPCDAGAMAEDLASSLDRNNDDGALLDRAQERAAQFSSVKTAEQTLASFQRAISDRKRQIPYQVTPLPDQRTLKPLPSVAVLVDLTAASETIVKGDAWRTFWADAAQSPQALEVIGLVSWRTSSKVRKAWTDQGGALVYVEEPVNEQVMLAMRHLVTDMAVSRYALILRLGEVPPGLFRELGYAEGMLDTKPEVASVVFGGDRLTVTGALSAAEIIRALEDHAQDPIRLFLNRMIRLANYEEFPLFSPRAQVQLLQQGPVLTLPARAGVP